MKRAMRICIDFDGVIIDAAQKKREWLASRVPMNFSDVRYDRTSLEKVVGRQLYRDMQSSVGFADTLLADPQPEALNAISILSRQSSLFLVTARAPEKMVWLKKWLDINGCYNFFGGVFSSFGKSKAEIIKFLEADYLIDDDERHLIDLPKNSHGILFCLNRNVSASNNILVANSWSQVLDIFGVS